MLTSLLIAVAPLALPSDPVQLVRAPIAGSLTVSVPDDFKDKMAEAGKDPEKLWALYQWSLEDDERKKYRKRVLKALIKVDPDHEEARLALGHVAYDGKWFETERERDKYAEKVAKERGLVKFKDEWVEPADVPFLSQGFVRNEYGDWVDPIALKRKAEGWKQQDLEWIAPADFDKIEQGLWKCDDTWLPLDRANEWHEDLEAPWKIPTKRAVIWATTTRETAMKAAAQAEQAWFDMQKVFGYGGDVPVPFTVVRDQAQYLRFMDGDEDFDLPQIDPFGVSGHSRAALADLYFDLEEGKYHGMGVTYWDADDSNGDNYGIHDARFAYGLSFVESLDPSFNAAADAIEHAGDKGVDRGRFLEARYQEHRIPRWLRWGAANYASRWFKDQQVKKGGNPRWAIEWSASNLRSQGGLADLDDVFEFDGRLENDQTATLILSAGLLVAYMVDGGNPELSKLLKEFQQQLQKGEDVQNILEQIRKKLADSEEEIRAYAGL
ncbi:hypothetical protein Poly30_56610 [Planctomycetes bacterium Poly30]|uniref:Uncharacterized protein n=1 Tax=Saltatorellus ferox TaxID=2528018 RepID=A0A518F195_9BACT|nr:hypothetical protein Poly30_56610 [Planctomycetes bacterium Poly30]